MKIDFSTINFAAIGLGIGVVLFYGRLLMAQRRKTVAWEKGRGWTKKKRLQMRIGEKPPAFGTFSRNRRDWVIGGAGYLLMMLGIALYIGWINYPPMKTGWWFIVTVGIFLFSWFFD